MTMKRFLCLAAALAAVPFVALRADVALRLRDPRRAHRHRGGHADRVGHDRHPRRDASTRSAHRSRCRLTRS